MKISVCALRNIGIIDNDFKFIAVDIANTLSIESRGTILLKLRELISTLPIEEILTSYTVNSLFPINIIVHIIRKHKDKLKKLQISYGI